MAKSGGWGVAVLALLLVAYIVKVGLPILAQVLQTSTGMVAAMVQLTQNIEQLAGQVTRLSEIVRYCPHRSFPENRNEKGERE